MTPAHIERLRLDGRVIRFKDGRIAEIISVNPTTENVRVYVPKMFQRDGSLYDLSCARVAGIGLDKWRTPEASALWRRARTAFRLARQRMHKAGIYRLADFYKQHHIASRLTIQNWLDIGTAAVHQAKRLDRKELYAGKTSNEIVIRDAKENSADRQRAQS